MVRIRGSDSVRVLVYESIGEADFMERMVTEIRSSRRIKRFASSTVETKWPNPGTGTKMSSEFAFSIDLFYFSYG